MTVRQLLPAAPVVVLHPAELADAAEMGAEGPEYLRWLHAQRLAGEEFDPEERWELTETGRRTLTRRQHSRITDAACVPGPEEGRSRLPGTASPPGLPEPSLLPEPLRGRGGNSQRRPRRSQLNSPAPNALLPSGKERSRPGHARKPRQARTPCTASQDPGPL